MFRLECGDKIECKFGGEYGTLTRKFVRKLTWNDQGKSDFFLIVDVIYRVTGWILNFQRAPSV